MNDLPPPYDTVVFDCDSTLSAVEGIDELARVAGVDVADLTRRAMDGELGLEEVYGLRLERIQPSAEDLDQVGELYIERALPHAAELVRALHFCGKRVVVLSGGLLPAVRQLAEHLGVSGEEVFAVDISFDEHGGYTGFDTASPLARGGGKPDVLRALKRSPEERVCLIGDGMTDLEAAPDVSRFVAFGGVERRVKVFEGALVHCEAPDLAALAPHLFSSAEIERLAGTPEHAPLATTALR